MCRRVVLRTLYFAVRVDIFLKGCALRESLEESFVYSSRVNDRVVPTSPHLFGCVAARHTSSGHLTCAALDEGLTFVSCIDAPQSEAKLEVFKLRRAIVERAKSIDVAKLRHQSCEGK